jgi:hypothetical protein
MITHIPVAKSNDESYEQDEREIVPLWFIPLYSEITEEMIDFLISGNYRDDRDDRDTFPCHRSDI